MEIPETIDDCPKTPQLTSEEVNSAEGDSLADLFLSQRSIALSLCPVAECSLWLEAPTTQPRWIKKSCLWLGLSTAGNVSKLISLQFFLFLSIFPPVKQKEPWEGNGCAGLHFHIEEIDVAELCYTG